MSDDGQVTWLRTDRVRFSQTTISGPTKLHGQDITLPDLVESFRQYGYISDPIQVVPMPDGRLTSLDNRRLWAAQQAGLEYISAIVRDPSDPFAAPREQIDHLQLRRGLRDRCGELGPSGAVLFETGSKPTTVFHAVLFRSAKQGRARSGATFPLLGSPEPPRYTGEKRPVRSPNLNKYAGGQHQTGENGVAQPGRQRAVFEPSRRRDRSRSRNGDLER